MTDGRPARWWRRDGDVVACDLCPNACRLGKDGSRGICGTRFRDGGELRTFAGGPPVAIHLDPIEKKPLYHFLPGSTTWSLGATGCNLGCRHCQNWRISMDRRGDPDSVKADPAAVADDALRLGASSVSFTYNEPLIAAESVIETALECRARGLRTIAVTNGYANEGCAREFFAAMDATNIDLKAFSETFYRRICKGRLDPVLRTLELVREAGRCHLEIAFLLIPGFNDADTELRAMGAWIRTRLGPDVPLHVTAFHPDHEMPDVPPTSAGRILQAREILRSEGMEFVYPGNIGPSTESDTRCPDCGLRLVDRAGYRPMVVADPTDGCPGCGKRIPGLFRTSAPDHDPANR